MFVKKDIDIQPGFEPGSSEFRSDALTNELLELLRIYSPEPQLIKQPTSDMISQVLLTYVHTSSFFFHRFELLRAFMARLKW